MENSTVKTAKDSEYNVRPRMDFSYVTLKEGAEKLKITPQRMSRLLRILRVPVHKRGHTILLDPAACDRIKEALMNKEVGPGRKKKGDARRGK